MVTQFSICSGTTRVARTTELSDSAEVCNADILVKAYGEYSQKAEGEADTYFNSVSPTLAHVEALIQRNKDVAQLGQKAASGAMTQLSGLSQKVNDKVISLLEKVSPPQKLSLGGLLTLEDPTFCETNAGETDCFTRRSVVLSSELCSAGNVALSATMVIPEFDDLEVDLSLKFLATDNNKVTLWH